MKRLIALILIFAVLCSFASCDEPTGEEYPVTVNDAVITVAPTKILALSGATSSLINYLGYGDKLVTGDFGTVTNPDKEAIFNSGADLIITTVPFSSSFVEKLNSLGIGVVTMPLPDNFAGLKEYYEYMGAVLGGNKTGKAAANEVYSVIDESFTNIETFLSGKEKYSAVMILENGYAAAKDSFASDIMQKCGANNIAENTFSITDKKLAELNPNTLFVPAGFKETVLANPEFAGVNAVANGRVFEINISAINLMSNEMMDAVYNLLEQRFPDFASGTPASSEEQQ